MSGGLHSHLTKTHVSPKGHRESVPLRALTKKTPASQFSEAALFVACGLVGGP